MSGAALYLLAGAGILAIFLVMHLSGRLSPLWSSLRDLILVIVAFVVTKKFWKSISLGIFAITFPLLPFFWGLLGRWILTTDQDFWTMSLGATYLDEWLVGVLSVGVVAATNWFESWFDFKMNFWSGLFTFLAGFGAFLFLAAYGVVHDRNSFILENPNGHATFIATIYAVGIGIILSSFLSIGESRRAKDHMGVA